MIDDDKKNQGEGDKESARLYNEHAREFVAGGKVDEAARQARADVDGPDAATLAAAEARGRKPAQLSLFERLEALVGRLRTGVSRVLHGRRTHGSRP
jgi:hypothetical protein